MNFELLKHFIKEYKINFERVNKQELYKWKAVKCFQDNWDIDSPFFDKMIKSSLEQTKNLMDSGQYFPKRMMFHYSEQKPEEVRALFKDLYDEEVDLLTRIENFQSGIESINNSLYPSKKSYQDKRAVVVYLTLKFPERYYFYKYEMYLVSSQKLNLHYLPKMGQRENLGHFNNDCELIRYELAKDQELLKLHKGRFDETCYIDENLNILTQDFLYAVQKHLETGSFTSKERKQSVSKIETESVENIETTSENQNSFKGQIINFIQNGIENKRIGDLGELWVIDFERAKLKSANKEKLSNKVKHISKEEGDGTGFDISSFDINGNPIFIEVKTTKGKANSTMFISKTELERSIIEKDNYFLYRLYNFNENEQKGDLLILQGDLTTLCNCPTTYKINLNTHTS